MALARQGSAGLPGLPSPYGHNVIQSLTADRGACNVSLTPSELTFLQVDMLVGDIYGNRDYSKCASSAMLPLTSCACCARR